MANLKNSIDMVNGPLWGKILKFTIYYMLTVFVQHLYGAADVVVVGRFAGAEALAGVGTCSSIINLLRNFILGLSAGASIVLGQAIGSKNDEVIGKTVHTSVATAIGGGFLISVICLLFTKELLHMIDVPEDVMGEASDYLRVMAVGFIPSLMYNFGSGILRAKGDSKRPLYIVTASGLINVVLNLFFVCALKMKASGVALATIISQLFTAVAILYILCNESDETKIELKKIRFYKEPFLKFLRFGIPSGIQSSTYSVSNVLVQSSINGFGSAATAGSAAATSVTEFYSLAGNSLYQSSIVFTSQNYGAKKLDRIKKTVLICFTYVGALWIIQSLITIFAAKPLLKLYIPDNPAALDMAMRKFIVLGHTYGILGILNVMSGALRGLGASFVNMISSIVGVCGIRIRWILFIYLYKKKKKEFQI